MRYNLTNCPANEALAKPVGNFFVLLFAGRTGSSFIVDVFNQHPLIKFECEWLRTFQGKSDAAAQQTAWINHFFRSASLDSYKAIGFKTNLYDIPDQDEFRRSLDQFRPTILLSLRRNLLKQAISAVRIEHYAEIRKQEMSEERWQATRLDADVWNIFEKGRGIGRTRLKIDEVNSMMLTLERSQNELEAFVQILDLDLISFDYEDLISGPRLFFNKMFNLLGVEPRPFKTKVFKHTPDDLSEAVENFDELLDFYAGTPYEKFFHESKKRTLSKARLTSHETQDPCSNGQDQHPLERLLSAVDIVSFDLFDTLVQREALFSPKDLFYCVQEQAMKRLRFRVDDFPSVRVRAEENARVLAWGLGVKEITLDDIYVEVGRMMNLSPDISQHLKGIELECEQAILTAMESGKQLFELVLVAGKTIVIISDTYFDQSFIDEVLRQSGYDKIKKVYVSSVLGMAKAEGGLYNFVLKDLACAPNKLLHIGDNPHSDVSMPPSKGIRAILRSIPKQQWRWRHGLIERPSGNLVISSMLSTFSRNDDQLVTQDNRQSLLSRIAIQNLSLLYLGFATWLVQQFRKQDYRRVYFAARDGLIMKRFFDLTAKAAGFEIESRYLYVSRAALYPSLIFTEPETARRLFCQNWDHITVRDALRRIALPYEEVRGDLVKHRLANLKLPLNRSTVTTFLQLLTRIWPLLKRKHEDGYRLLIDYLRQEEVLTTERAAFVDIGWHGSLQNCLLKLLEHLKIKKELSGYYLGTFEKPLGATKSFKASGYLVESDEPAALAALIRSSPSLLELFHSAEHGGVLGYKRNGAEILPELENNPEEHQQFQEIIEPMQNLAFDFVAQQLAQCKCTLLQPPEPALIARTALRVIYGPTIQEANIFGRLKIASDFGGSMKSITGVGEWDLKKINGETLPDGTQPIWRPGFEILRRA